MRAGREGEQSRQEADVFVWCQQSAEQKRARGYLECEVETARVEVVDADGLLVRLLLLILVEALVGRDRSPLETKAT